MIPGSEQTGTTRTVIAVAGTRPEVVKLAPVIHALRRYPGLHTRLVFTGQQAVLGVRALVEYDLEPDSRICFGDRARALRPDIRFMTRRIQHELERLCTGGSPGPWVLVQGDTLSALAGARAALRCGLQVAHLEAGLRSGDLMQPFPEEIVRRLIARYCTLHLAPNPAAVDTLVREGADPAAVRLVGNPALDQLPLPAPKGRDILVTLHRRETFGAGLRHIFERIGDLAERFEQHRFIVLEHSNPRVREALGGLRVGGRGNLQVSPPLARAAFLRLLSSARLVMTDSGGVQEEAAALGVPTLVLRNVADRPDGLDCGNTTLVGNDPDAVYARTVSALEFGGRAGSGSSRVDSRAGMDAARAVARAMGASGDDAGAADSEPAALGRVVDDWLFGDALVSDAGAVAGAVGADGQVLYYYPEIAGYYLSWLARYGDPAGGHAGPLAARIFRAIADRAGAAPPATRTGAGLSGDWRNNAVFLFDLAMLARGVGECRQVFPDLDCGGATDTLRRWLAPFLDAGEDAVPALYRRNDQPIPERWSTTSGPYQYKALAALAEFARACGDERWQAFAEDGVDVLCRRFSPGNNPHANLPHPTLYAAEGLLALGRPAEAAAYAAPILDGVERALHGVAGDTLEWLRTDVLAQALRCCASLPLPDVPTASLLGELARRLADTRAPGRDPGQPPVVRVWAMLFISEALHLLQGDTPAVGQGHV